MAASLSTWHKRQDLLCDEVRNRLRGTHVAEVGAGEARGAAGDGPANAETVQQANNSKHMHGVRCGVHTHERSASLHSESGRACTFRMASRSS